MTAQVLQQAETRSALEALGAAEDLLTGIALIDEVTEAAWADGARALEPLREALTRTDDHLRTIAAVHAAAAAGPEVAGELLVGLLTCEVAFLREHAAWALHGCPPLTAALRPLGELAAAGGFTGMLAQRTLDAWTTPTGPAPSTGSVPRDRRPVASTITDSERGRGLTVCQLFLHSELDGSLLHVGQGDTGGIATLLVHLGDALLAEPGIQRVLTVSGTRADPPAAPPAYPAHGHSFPTVPLPGPAVPAARAWVLRAEAREGIRRILTAAGRVDVLHLRMADVGSWVAAEVAEELGIPVVLTMAPDPHALIAAREAAGEVTRANLGEVDHREHWIFRVRLLRALADQAAHLVVFPRPHLDRDLSGLLHLGPADRRRLTVVPEGIDVALVDEAAEQVEAFRAGKTPTTAVTRALDDLAELLDGLPPARRGLPLIISVGRMDRVKGMGTLVEAWAGDPELADRCNVLIVGGDLASPNPQETAELARIDAIIPRDEQRRHGLLLAGHRPNTVVAAWLAAVRQGLPELGPVPGIYVSASLKEEFGIAILEALASGLVVVAPRAGGPATYLDDGVTGVLADTGSVVDVRRAIAAAFDIARADDTDARAAAARAYVEEHFSIQTMAAALAALYHEVAAAASDHTAALPAGAIIDDKDYS